MTINHNIGDISSSEPAQSGVILDRTGGSNPMAQGSSNYLLYSPEFEYGLYSNPFHN